MLDHTKPYVEKIHYIDVENAEFVCEWLFSVCCMRSCGALSLPLWSELTNKTLRKQRWVHIYPQIWMP